jgi:RNA polymerase sigma factor (sigma-70 family)
MTDDSWLAERFEEHRPRLRAVACRMLGSSTDAEDAVQEAWVRFSRSDTSAVENLGSWLTTVVSRVCLNTLGARRSRPETPVGLELPEPPAGAAPESDPVQEVLLADSIGLALLVVLDTLSPPERVALVLHDIFGVPFEQIAPVVGRNAAAARQLTSRARRRVRMQNADPHTHRLRQAMLVDAFLAAARTGEFDQLLSVLDPDVVLRADRAGVQLGAPAEAQGAAAVAEFCRRARGAVPALLNGAAAAAWMPGGQLRVVFQFTVSDHKITAIDLIAEPARLHNLNLEAPLE